MSRKLLVIIGVLLCGVLLLPQQTTHAVDVTVSSCTEAALDNAVAQVNAAGGKITFSCSGTISLTTQKMFDGGKDYEIDGLGQVTLDGQNQTRIILVKQGSDSSLTLRGLTFTRGRATVAADDAIGLPNGGQGGAFFFHYGNRRLEIYDSTFTNNIAEGNRTYDGGGVLHIRNADWLQVENSTFSNNAANNGGVMNILITPGHLLNNAYTNNTATNTNAGGGGAIYIDNGQLTFENSTFFGNSSGYLGGGYFNAGGSRNIGGETLINLTFSGNSAGTQGGGVYSVDDPLVVTGSTFHNNTATGNAGGLAHESKNNTSFTAQITNSTFSENRSGNALVANPDPDTAKGNGGGIVNSGAATMTLTNVTLYENATGVQGSAVRTGNGQVIIRNSIIANNTSTFQWINEQCYGNIVDGGGNIQFPAKDPTYNREARCFTNRSADGNPLLQDLADNGGTTWTHNIAATSPAVDAGQCFVNVDQRGFPRPQGQRCDAGAVELFTANGPSNLSLVGGLGTAPVRPGFRWDGNDGEWYGVTITRSSGTVLTQWLAANDLCNGDDCEFTPAQLSYEAYGLLNGEYSWYVQSWAETVGSASSMPQNFTVGLDAPQITGMTPGNGANELDGNIALAWDADSNALWYRVALDGPGDYASDQWYEAAQICNSGTCQLPAADYAFGRYDWWMQAWGPGGLSDWTDTFFYSGPPAPDVIERIAPQGALDDVAPTFQWEADPNAEWYQVYLVGPNSTQNQWFAATDSIVEKYGATGFEGVCDGATCTVPVTQSNWWIPNGEYSWWVGAWGPGGLSEWATAPFEFTLSLDAPAPVTQSTPVDNGTVAAGSVAVTWQAEPDAAWYNIYIGGDNGYVHYEWHETGAVCAAGTCTITLDLNAGSYDWYMNAWGPGGLAGWNGGTGFTVTP